MSTHPIGHSLSFTIPTPPASKKNGRRWLKFGGRMRFVPSDAARRDERDVANIAHLACGGVMPFDADDALHIGYEHDIDSDTVEVTVTKIGTLPSGKKGKKRGTKRDVISIAETLADALQGVLYPNDNAVDAWAIGRRR